MAQFQQCLELLRGPTDERRYDVRCYCLTIMYDTVVTYHEASVVEMECRLACLSVVLQVCGVAAGDQDFASAE